MRFADCLRKRMVIRDEDEGRISELARRKRIVTVDDGPIVDAFPSTTSIDRLLICQPIAFETAECVEFAVFAGSGFIEPRDVTESGCVSLIVGVQRDERMEMVNIRW